MSDKELDEILEEIKMRVKEEMDSENQANPPATEKKADTNVMDDILKSIKPEEEEPSSAENNNTLNFTLPEEEKKEEIPFNENKTVVFTMPNEDEENEISEIEPPIDYREHEESSAPKEFDFMSFSDENEPSFDEEDFEEKKSKKPLIIAIAVILIIAIGAGVYFGFFHKKDNKNETTATKAPQTTQAEVVADLGPINPLTGETGYNQAQLGKRPVAVVVENEYSTESVRPQWGLNEADIVLEGESEYSTRLLLFWADYTNMPAQIGSTRSARPPFIRFSQLFDAVFIHAGLSKSKGNYIGANTVFEQDNVDHINLLRYSEDGTYFGRDKSRTSTIEHTGYLNGKNTAELLKKAGINTSLNSAKFTELDFNEKPEKLSQTAATSAKFIWSDVYSKGHCPKVGKFYYDESLEKYSTTDFDSDYGKANLEFENLIFLLDETEYIVKQNYKGSQSETYCDYKLSGGKGTILSQGTALEITWGVSNGKLWMKDSNGESVKLNPGKSYIGYGSSNKGGKVTLNYENQG